MPLKSGALVVNSLYKRPLNPGHIAEPPERTMLLKSSQWSSVSHFFTELRIVSASDCPSSPGDNNDSMQLNRPRFISMFFILLVIHCWWMYVAVEGFKSSEYPFFRFWFSLWDFLWGVINLDDDTSSVASRDGSKSCSFLNTRWSSFFIASNSWS